MSSLFRSPKPPEPQRIPDPAPPPPTIIDASRNVEQSDDMKRRRKRGRAATMLAGERGAGTPQTATRTLLGQ
jgi:hypothetical protein